MAAQEGGRGATRVAVTLASALFSLALHGSVLAAALFWTRADPGAIVVPTDAISIELVRSDVTEAVASSELLESVASLASVQADAGADHDMAASDARANEVKPLAPDEQLTAAEISPEDVSEEAPEGIETLKGALQAEEAIGRELSKHKAKPEREAKPSPQKPKRIEKTARLTEPSPPKETKSAASKKGGASSKAAKGSAASSGRVSASTGSAVNYAALVRARVAARRPAGGGRRGTVVVSFGVSRSGSLTYASIGRSSGDAGLDRSVLAAVRSAGPFPVPPPGANLRFSVPFYFR